MSFLSVIGSFRVDHCTYTDIRFFLPVPLLMNTEFSLPIEIHYYELSLVLCINFRFYDNE